MAELLTLRESSFQPLVPTILFFRSLPKARDHRWGKERRSTSKSRASPFSSAPSSPRRTGKESAWLQTLHQSACQSPAPLSSHSWTRPWETWPPPPRARSPRRPRKGWEPWPQIWRCWFSFWPLHTRLRTDPARAGGPPVPHVWVRKTQNHFCFFLRRGLLGYALSGPSPRTCCHGKPYQGHKAPDNWPPGITGTRKILNRAR